jgi:hemolysin D
MGINHGRIPLSSSQMADTTDGSIAIQSADLDVDSNATAMTGAYATDLSAAKSNYQWPEAVMIRILIVDDQKSIRERLKYILEPEPDFEIVGMVDNGYDAIEQVKIIEPDVVLMDMEMPDIDGVLATKIIAHSELSKKVRVLVLSSHDSNEYVARSIHAGAKGYLLKGATPQEIQDAVRFVHRGYTQIAPGLFEQFIPELPPKSSGVSYGQPRPIPTELDVTGLSGLAITGFKIQRRAADTPVLLEDASGMLFDVVETRVGSKTTSWAQVAAGITLALGTIGSIYFVRQGLQHSPVAITASERANKLQEMPFSGRIEAQQTNKINATVPGFVQEVKVRVGQTVKQGDVLMTIRNVDAERTNQEKAQQSQQQAMQQQQALVQQQQSQQQVLLQQQQSLIQQQQASQQRSNILEQQLAAQNQTIAPLRNKLSNANLQISQSQLQANQSLLLQQRSEAVQKARSNYDLQRIESDKRQRSYRARLQLFESGVISRDQVDQTKAEADSAKVAMQSAKSDYDNARQALVLAQKNRADSQPVESQKLRDQQQLELKEQEEKVTKLQSQLQQERLSYQQLSSNLQALRQRSLATPSPVATAANANNQPVLIDITAATNGSVVELPISAGDQVFSGNKLISIANPQQLKTTVEVEEKLAATLQVGRRTFVKIKSGSDVRDYTGKVANISPTGENRKQKVEVEFQVGNDFFVGQPATIYFPMK